MGRNVTIHLELSQVTATDFKVQLVGLKFINESGRLEINIKMTLITTTKNV